MNIWKWLTLGLAGSSLASFANSAPLLNSNVGNYNSKAGHYNPCYSANFQAARRAAEHGIEELMYDNAPSANECHSGKNGASYVICLDSGNGLCDRRRTDKLDTSTRSEGNINNPCLEYTANAGRQGYFTRGKLITCPPSPDDSEKFPVKEGDNIKQCPINPTEPCAESTTRKNKIDKKRWFGGIG